MTGHVEEFDQLVDIVRRSPHALRYVNRELTGQRFPPVSDEAFEMIRDWIIDEMVDSLRSYAEDYDKAEEEIVIAEDRRLEAEAENDRLSRENADLQARVDELLEMIGERDVA